MHLTVCTTLFALTLVSVVKPSPLSPSQPSILTTPDGNYSSFIASLPNITTSLVAVESLQTECSEQFGVNPVFSDCQSARDHISSDVAQYLWGARHTGLPDNVFPLPYRIMGRKLLRENRLGSRVIN